MMQPGAEAESIRGKSEQVPSVVVTGAAKKSKNHSETNKNGMPTFEPARASMSFAKDPTNPLHASGQHPSLDANNLVAPTNQNLHPPNSPHNASERSHRSSSRQAADGHPSGAA